MSRKKNNKSTKLFPSQNNHNSKNGTMKVMDADSNVALQLTIRHPKEEKGIIVSDSDWDDIKLSYKKLKSVNNVYYTWSGVCFSTSVTLLITLLTFLFDKQGDVVHYVPAYIMSIFLVFSIVIGIILIVKGKGKASTIESAIDSLNTVIGRIERKTSGLDNIQYYGDNVGDRI